VTSLRPASAFRSDLEACVGTDGTARPFVCAGNPYCCKAFLVGINPASSVPFWPFWDDEEGFDKALWFECYRKQRGKLRKPPVSPTRRAIESRVEAAAPVKILETNLFSTPTPRAAVLHKEDRQTRAFEFLLAEIRPHVLLLHGQPARGRFEHRLGCSLTPCFSPVIIGGQTCMIAAVPHLFNASHARARKLGEAIRRACSLPA
jgi:hypothetical protein